MSFSNATLAADPNRLCKKRGVSSVSVTVLVAVYLLLAFNLKFFLKIYEIRGWAGSGDTLFFITIFLFMLVVFVLFLSLFGFPWLFKPVAILLIILGSVTCYFMNSYGVMIEKTMLQNVIETDVKEGLELLGSGFYIWAGLTGLLPAWLLYVLPVKFGSFASELLKKLLVVVLAMGAVGAIAATFYQDYASLFRNHRNIRDLIVPLNVLYSVESYIKHLMPVRNSVHSVVGSDAHLESDSVARPRVVVLVVGETARADHFSLNGYPRETNPKLSRENVVNFTQAESCGTTTAVSVPCMFSDQTRANFVSSDFGNRDNLLDLIQRAGVDVSWLENNTGCKGVCDRVRHIELNVNVDSADCHDDECVDEVFLKPLEQAVQAATGDTLIIVHQQGSHGPAYFRRVPKAFEIFTPICRSVELQRCSQQEVINAYDNTIVYTDFVLGRIINILKSQGGKQATAMFYLSDHGESLGENNLYLHGIPFNIAPAAQKHIPVVAWFSEMYLKDGSLTSACLDEAGKRAWSQDNLYSTVLGLMSVSTALYDPRMDSFASCRQAYRGLADVANSAVIPREHM